MTNFLIAPEALDRWIQGCFTAAGSSQEEARLVADHLVQANLTGHDSHGVGMVPKYIDSWAADALQLMPGDGAIGAAHRGNACAQVGSAFGLRLDPGAAIFLGDVEHRLEQRDGVAVELRVSHARSGSSARRRARQR